jgi:hypothetical protein
MSETRKGQLTTWIRVKTRFLTLTPDLLTGRIQTESQTLVSLKKSQTSATNKSPKGALAHRRSLLLLLPRGVKQQLEPEGSDLAFKSQEELSLFTTRLTAPRIQGPE